MIFLERLRLKDENNAIIYDNSKYQEAEPALMQALIFIRKKDGKPKSKIKNRFWEELDREFTEYFKL